MILLAFQCMQAVANYFLTVICSTKISDNLSKYKDANAIIHSQKKCHFKAQMIDLKMADKYSVINANGKTIHYTRLKLS